MNVSITQTSVSASIQNSTISVSLIQTPVTIAIGSSITLYHLNFDGVDDAIVIPASASLNNLPLGDFTVELSGIINDPAAGNAPILEKFDPDTFGGWFLQVVGATNVLSFTVTADEWNGYYDFSIPIPTGENNIEIVWKADTRTALFFVNGVAVSATSDIATGTSLDDDSPGDLQIFTSGLEWALGQLNWVRIFNIARHASGFTPPSLTICPDADANTVLRLALDDGSGAVAEDTSGNQNNGTITGATWEQDS
jgi:hypothetical protein